jgi:ribose/xylose/arabinose/galactoside ABC-type transport system permease subunit
MNKRSVWRSPLAILRIAATMVLALAALLTPGFVSEPNLLSLVTTVSFIGCVAVGMTLITISGNIMSFSLGALVGATAMIFILAVNVGGVAFGLAAAFAFAAVINAAQGFLIGTVRANPIIISIASTALIYGVAEGLSEQGTVYAAADVRWGLLQGKVLGLPVEFVALIGAAAIAQVLLSYTVFGRHLLMTGSSLAAAEVIGLRTWRTVTGAYLWAGLFAGLAGILLAIRYGSASMNYGIGYEYDAMAAVLVGGTSIRGGEGSALRTLVGALVIAVIEAVLLLWGFRQEWQFLIAGVIVLAVVALQTRGRRD